MITRVLVVLMPFGFALGCAEPKSTAETDAKAPAVRRSALYEGLSVGRLRIYITEAAELAFNVTRCFESAQAQVISGSTALDLLDEANYGKAEGSPHLA